MRYQIKWTVNILHKYKIENKNYYFPKATFWIGGRTQIKPQSWSCGVPGKLLSCNSTLMQVNSLPVYTWGVKYLVGTDDVLLFIVTSSLLYHISLSLLQVTTSLIPGQWCLAEFWMHCFSLKHRKHCCLDSVRGLVYTVLLPLGVKENTTRRLIFSQLSQSANSIAVDVCRVFKPHQI